ncbi:DUF5372 family protein [Paenibacillus sp. BR2-3]|uniref:DUF5372 family protein n=1 Tax=Paenibacillus sp. BR2-3 TaxID=3048494 RepID=UPI0039772E9E
MVSINHPFHPLQGQSFTLLSIREVKGLRRYSLQTDTGVVCVPETWTNHYASTTLPPANLSYDLLTLKELAQFLHTLEESHT